MTQNGTLTPKQARGVECLLTARTTQAAAKCAGVSFRQMCRWMKEPHFQRALQDAQGAALSETIRGLTHLSGDTLDVFADSLKAGSPGIRLRAADTILGRLLQLRDAHEIEQRLQALEKKADK